MRASQPIFWYVFLFFCFFVFFWFFVFFEPQDHMEPCAEKDQKRIITQRAALTSTAMPAAAMEEWHTSSCAYTSFRCLRPAFVVIVYLLPASLFFGLNGWHNVHLLSVCGLSVLELIEISLSSSHSQSEQNGAWSGTFPVHVTGVTQCSIAWHGSHLVMLTEGGLRICSS